MPLLISSDCVIFVENMQKRCFILLKFSVANFYSIKDTLTVDFEAAQISTEKARVLADNVFSVDDKKLLKAVGIFGPNASGKSSIFKVLFLYAVDFRIPRQQRGRRVQLRAVQIRRISRETERIFNQLCL